MASTVENKIQRKVSKEAKQNFINKSSHRESENHNECCNNNNNGWWSIEVSHKKDGFETGLPGDNMDAAERWMMPMSV